MQRSNRAIPDRLGSRLLATLLLTFAFLTAATAALAAEVTRDSYTEAVEPICKLNVKANEKLLTHVKSEVKQGHEELAGKQLLQASTALKKTYLQLRPVPQPTEDTAKLTKWLAYVKLESELFAQTGRALKAGNKGKATSLSTKLNNTANLANDQVLNFNFRYCRFEPSKYT